MNESIQVVENYRIRNFMNLWTILWFTIWCTNKVSTWNPVFNAFLKHRNKDDDGSDSYEEYTDEYVSIEDEDLPRYEYYESVLEEALKIFGENQETISMVKRQLDQASGEDINGLSRQLCNSLQSANDLINEKTKILREKYRTELKHLDMTNPIEESTLNTLSSLWKEVKQILAKIKSNKKMDGVEELEKWLDNVDRQTRSHCSVIQDTMAKLESMRRDGNNKTRNQIMHNNHTVHERKSL